MFCDILYWLWTDRYKQMMGFDKIHKGRKLTEQEQKP
jgi:hypothetical protein